MNKIIAPNRKERERSNEKREAMTQTNTTARSGRRRRSKRRRKCAKNVFLTIEMAQRIHWNIHISYHAQVIIAI